MPKRRGGMRTMHWGPAASRSQRPAVMPESGQLVRRRMLGSDAIYRVVGTNPRGIELEVVHVPGLKAGSRYTFLPEDVAAMDAVTD